MRLIILAVLYSPVFLEAFDSDDFGLSIPNDAVGRPPLPLRENYSIKRRDPLEANKCYCTYEEGICDSNRTCIKDSMAACFHAVEEVFNKELRTMETLHKYGCAPLEKGSDASHLTCNSWRSSHFHPKSIACCYEGNYCNKNITPPPYVNAPDGDSNFEDVLLAPSRLWTILLFVLFLVIAIVGLATFAVLRWRKSEKSKLRAATDQDVEKEPILIDDSGSGSGSGKTTLNQRTVAQDLEIIEVIGRGRYGEVRKALYRGSYVAVKTFHTTEEESWKNEREIYQTHMLNHENILQFVAADISSEESSTQMLLITDYHDHGSLYDYLRRDAPLTMEEALQLAYSTVCGIEHLHNAVHGTGSRRKPEIAHRDIKSRNIIVKRRGVCCVADFGLAVRFEGKLIPERVNVQVGTKRYMAPEVLTRTLISSSFSQFKMADMYAYALVLWEIARRMEWPTLEAAVSTNGLSSDSGIGESVEGSGSSSRSRLLDQQGIQPSTKAMPYVQPFEESVGKDPSFDEMIRVVCEERKRPPLEESWMNKNNVTMYRLAGLMRDCWHHSASCRHTALKVKMALGKTIEALQDNEAKTRYQKHSTSSNPGSTKRDTVDSGFRENVS